MQANESAQGRFFYTARGYYNGPWLLFIPTQNDKFFFGVVPLGISLKKIRTKNLQD